MFWLSFGAVLVMSWGSFGMVESGKRALGTGRFDVREFSFTVRKFLSDYVS